MSEEPRILVVSDAEGNTRLDVILAKHLAIGRAAAQRMIADGAVQLNGSFAAPKGTLVSPGQRIEIAAFAGSGEQMVIPRPDLPLVELQKGPGWIAVDKPAGWPVHPLHADESETLLNAAVARYPQIQNVGEGGLRSGVVHRLDIDTSGVILLATEQKTWQHLRRAFEEHRMKKIYRAIVAGKMNGGDRLVLDLRIAQHSPARVKVVEDKIIPKPTGTRRCDLTWRSIQSLRNATLVEIDLGTGFLHQIRVMLAHIGHPVLGDKTYGSPTSDIPRQMLHAHSIRIGDIYAESPEPADFSDVFLTLRLNQQ
jgi:23S rRNA pseudouridine1911/1915/1917 synthase